MATLPASHAAPAPDPAWLEEAKLGVLAAAEDEVLVEKIVDELCALSAQAAALASQGGL